MAGRQQKPPRSRVAFSHALPKLDGAQLEATLVEVTYDPGGSNTAHRHPCPVVGYVLEGAVRMHVKGQAEPAEGGRRCSQFFFTQQRQKVLETAAVGQVLDLDVSFEQWRGQASSKIQLGINDSP